MKNKILITFIFIINILALPLNIDNNLLKWVILSLSIFIPTIIKLKISINNYVETLYLILIFFSFTLGRLYNLYDKIYWYDTLVHSISGILVFLFAIYIINKYSKEKNKYIKIIFAITINTFIDVLWECIELFSDYIFNTNMMKIPETGVLDTMKDLSVACIFSIITSFFYLKKMKKIKK